MDKILTKDEAIRVLVRITNCYLDIFKEDFLEEENQEEYIEILQALEVLNG